MFYEVRTYQLKPGTVGECERLFADALHHRERYSPLGAFWHTEVGPLNQIIHVWPYEDLAQRSAVRAQAAKDPNWPPRIGGLIEHMESEIFVPAPFMEPLPRKELGGFYEICTHHYRPGSLPEVLRRWAECVPRRVQLSPLVACWYSELGELNTFVHIWPYIDHGERTRVGADAVERGVWPPDTREFLVSQTNKIVVPAPFSPLR